MQESWGLPLGQEDLLEKEMAIHFSVLGAAKLGKFSVKGTYIFMKGLEQRRVQHRTGVKVYRVQALVD